jgi:hypothetical protein
VSLHENVVARLTVTARGKVQASFVRATAVTDACYPRLHQLCSTEYLSGCYQ